VYHVGFDFYYNAEGRVLKPRPSKEKIIFVHNNRHPPYLYCTMYFMQIKDIAKNMLCPERFEF
jgi:hypothetical protein